MVQDYAKKKWRGSAEGTSRPVPAMKSGGALGRPPSGRVRGLILLIILIGVSGIFLYAGGRYFWREMRWRYIVVHHTASDVGDLDYYRKLHMEERGWPDIAYHFLINNGSYNTAVGQVEVSNLWKRRSHHYSTRKTYLNYFGIAVVLVGNFEKHDVPALQRESLIQLLYRLAKDYNIPPEHIVGHREVWNTACPGKHLNMIQVRRDVARLLKENKE